TSAGEPQVAARRGRGRPFGIVARRRGKGRAALAHDLPWWQRLGKTGNARDFVPEFLRQHLTWNVEQAVGRADRDRQPIGKGKEPFDGSVHDPDDGRKPSRRIEPAIVVDDSAKLGGPL